MTVAGPCGNGGKRFVLSKPLWESCSLGFPSEVSVSTGLPFLGFFLFLLLFFFLCFSDLITFLQRSPESKRFRPRLDDVRAIGDAIQYRFAEARIREDLSPFRKG
jgi:hypothetical protein